MVPIGGSARKSFSCEEIARSEPEYERLLGDEEFRIDWEMEALADLAREHLGPLLPEFCYCLKIPAVLGGTYDRDNLGTISRLELVSFAGDIAEQIKDVPDGERVEIKLIP